MRRNQSWVLVLLAATLCICQVIAGSCPDGSAATLDAHNVLRYEAGLSSLEWSSDLEVSAQAWANYLADGACQAESSGKKGESVYVSADHSPDCVEAASSWLGVFNSPSARSMKSDMLVVLSGATTALGCAMANSPTQACSVVVCHYDYQPQDIQASVSSARRLLLDISQETSEETSEESSAEESSDELGYPSPAVYSPPNQHDGSGQGRRSVQPPPPPPPSPESDYVDYYSKDPIYRKLRKLLDS